MSDIEISLEKPVPITILTGFLGAGKTTLLNHILHGKHGLRVAVLVNDFGAINIDSQLIVGVEGESISLSNGCICCTIRDDLLEAVFNLVEGLDRPEYIIIETSGVSDPMAVAGTFLLPQLRPYVQVDSIITVIDAEQLPPLRGQYGVLAMDQVSVADIIVLNKVDLVTAAHLERFKEEYIRRIVPDARILETTFGQVPLELLLGVGMYDPERMVKHTAKDIHVHPEGETSDHEHHHDHEHPENHEHEEGHEHHHHDHTLVFSSWSWSNTEPLSFRQLRKVLHELPETIFRAKGVLYLADTPDRRGIFHMVGTRAMLTLGDEWGDTPPRSQVVAIGTPGGFSKEQLDSQFDSCLASNAANGKGRITTAMQWLRKTS